MCNNKLIYPAVFKRDDEYIMVSFPDLPECNTQGETFIEAFLAAREALGLYLDGMETYPKATEFEDIEEQGGTRVLLVDADLDNDIKYENIDIAEILSSAALKKGYSKYRIAKILGKSESYVNRIFSGERTPAPDLAQQLSALLGIDWRIFFVNKVE